MAALGFGLYEIAEPRLRIDLHDQIAPAMFAFASVIGVFAGFAATAVVFIAGASGPSIERMRRNEGSRLTNALLGSVVTLFASAIGLVYLWAPFMLLAIYLSLLNFNFELLEVAKVCGAKPWRAFVEVTWPLNRMGTMIGVVLVFVPTFAATMTPRFLGGPDGAMFANRLEHQFGATGTWALGSAMGVVLFGASLLVIYLAWRSIDLKRSGFTGAGG